MLILEVSVDLPIFATHKELINCFSVQIGLELGLKAPNSADFGSKDRRPKSADFGLSNLVQFKFGLKSPKSTLAVV